VEDKAFTGRTWQYRTENAAYMISDMYMLDAHRIVVMERDGGRGLAANFPRPGSRFAARDPRR
jgi:hypothetical protein